MSLHRVTCGVNILYNNAFQRKFSNSRPLCCFKEKSFDRQPVGKEKHDPNAVTTRVVMASVGTGCGGFQGYFFP